MKALRKKFLSEYADVVVTDQRLHVEFYDTCAVVTVDCGRHRVEIDIDLPSMMGSIWIADREHVKPVDSDINVDFNDPDSRERLKTRLRVLSGGPVVERVQPGDKE